MSARRYIPVRGRTGHLVHAGFLTVGEDGWAATGTLCGGLRGVAYSPNEDFWRPRYATRPTFGGYELYVCPRCQRRFLRLQAIGEVLP